ncbi:MAG: hypothetical protein AAF840_13535, partial [Bacteroidota bacterium]
PAPWGLAPQPERVRPVTKSAPASRSMANSGGGFDFSKLISAGKILVPAAQAIISVIQEQQKNKG